ncbi:MAG: hypothetical protein QXH27_00390 [Candidatus Micrarchaeia archaeon]
MAFNLVRTFGSVFNAVVRRAGDIGKRLLTIPTPHLVRVARVSRDVKSEAFKKLMQATRATQEEQAKFMMEIPSFVNYVARIKRGGRNRELIAKRPPIRLPPGVAARPPPKTRQAA